jgi:hypothetical protein
MPTTSFGQTLLREPLLHFVLLGGLVFAAEHVLRAQRSDPRLILVGPEVEREARDIFRTAKGRDPSASELNVLRERWIDNEVLYREGLALRLEQGDPTLRERIIFKALNVIESNLRLPDGDDASLQAYFDSHRDQYDEQARFEFSEAVLSEPGAEAAQRLAAALSGGAQADVQSGLRIFKDRPRNTIVEAFGPRFANALDSLALREWQVLESKDGPRLVRLEARVAGAAVSFEDVRTKVLLDWRDAKAAELRTAAVRELGKKYTVQIDGSSS